MENLQWCELWNGLEKIDPQLISSGQSLYIPASVTTLTKSHNGVQWCTTVINATSLKIYCESTSKPNGWDSYFNAVTTKTESSNVGPSVTKYAPVTWGVSRETYRANNRYLNN